MGSMQTIEESKQEQDYSGTLLSNSDSNTKFGPNTLPAGAAGPESAVFMSSPSSVNVPPRVLFSSKHDAPQKT